MIRLRNKKTRYSLLPRKERKKISKKVLKKKARRPIIFLFCFFDIDVPSITLTPMKLGV